MQLLKIDGRKLGWTYNWQPFERYNLTWSTIQYLSINYIFLNMNFEYVILFVDAVVVVYVIFF